ncbi:major facilitator superfamily domain-containing protein [Trichophaea hybrida]|nr:major facilitator superfamily domain-containing protein [Trichophaea hybrida]
MEAKMRKKFDRVILPVVTLIYLMAFIDRSNMGNAKIMGMEEDLVLKDLVGAHTFLFGLITPCIAFLSNHIGLVAARVILGVAETGIIPGIIYTLSTFYRRHELVTRVGIYASVASVAGGFGGLMATGFSQVPQRGMVHSWRNIFFFEGALTIVAAGICYFLPNSPGEASFLTEDERALGVRQIQLEALTLSTEKIQRRHFTASILNLNTWLISIGLFCSLLCMNSIALFIPSLLRTMKFTSYVLGSIRTHNRRRIRTTKHSRHYRGEILCAVLATMGAFTAGPVFISWTVDNSTGLTVRAIASAFAVSMGTTGGLVATWMYLPTLFRGLLMLLCVVVVATGYLRWENRQRDMGKRDYRVEGKSEEVVAILGHSHPAFRYTP